MAVSDRDTLFTAYTAWLAANQPASIATKVSSPSVDGALLFAIADTSGGGGGGGTSEATITSAINASTPTTSLASVLAAVDGLEASVDGVEASLTSILAGIAAIQLRLNPKLIRYASAAFSASGDTTAIDISALSGYVAGDQIAIITAIVQTVVNTPESFILFDSGIPSPSFSFVQRVYAPTIGTGLALPVEWALPANTDLMINKAGTVNSQYSFAYYLRQAV